MSKHGPIREVFIGAMTQAGHMGWMVGLMDSAANSLQIVLDDARKNLARNPQHKLTIDAVQTLSKAVEGIHALCLKLETVASGEDQEATGG